MRIVTFANGKGGVAKTTSTLGFAAVAAEAGLSVLVVDVDPQGSAAMILNRRKEIQGIEAPFDWTHETAPEFLHGIRSQGDWDFVLVDTPGSLEGHDVLAAVISDADYVVLPSNADVMSLSQVIDTVTMIRGIRDVPHKVLITRAHVQRGVVSRDAQSVLSDAGVPSFRDSIRAYTLYDDMQVDGSLVTDRSKRLKQVDKALADYSSAWTELTSHWLRSGR